MNSNFFKKALLVVVLLLAFCLRFNNLEQIPPSPYWEEVALGYDAYSIAETGRDHHGNPWPIVAFESFGDWKPSLYFYAITPFINVFGLSVLAIRLPSVLAGVAIVWAVGELAKWVMKDRSEDTQWLAQLIAMFLTAVSPWAIQFSRGGWESNLASALITWGMVLGLRAFDKSNSKIRTWALLLSTLLLLILSMYAYHGARLMAPLLGLVLAIYWLPWDKKQALGWLRSHILEIAIGLGFGFLLALPLGMNLFSPVIQQRAAETSIFTLQGPVIQSNALKETFNSAWWTRIAFHRYWFYGREVVSQYLKHLTLDFLFLSGDANPRHSTGFFGIMYYLDSLLIGSGLLWLVSAKNRKKTLVILSWLLLGILPAAITQAAPHALRILVAMPALMVVLAVGGVVGVDLLNKFLKTKLPKLFSKYLFKVLILFFVAGYLVQVGWFWRYYTQIYPALQSSHWQYGYQEMVESLQELMEKYPDDRVFVSREQGRPAMYYWFYTQTDPRLVQAADDSTTQDQGEYLSFENITFVRSADEAISRPAIVAATATDFERSLAREDKTEVLKEITDQQGRVVWMIWRVE